MPTRMSEPAELLRGAGLRVTGPRLATLRALDARPHASADEVATAARQRLGAVSTQAIYDVLRACTEAGIVRRFEAAGSRALYELRVGDNHHHLVCRLCGAVEDVDCAVGAAPCLVPSDDRGYLIDEAEVVYRGVCSQCTEAAPPLPTTNNPTRATTTRTKE